MVEPEHKREELEENDSESADEEKSDNLDPVPFQERGPPEVAVEEQGEKPRKRESPNEDGSEETDGDLYEDMGSLGPGNNDSEMYELVTYDQTTSQPSESVEKEDSLDAIKSLKSLNSNSSLGAGSSPGYVHMEPAPAEMEQDVYETMTSPGAPEEDDDDYEKTEGWNGPSSNRSSAGFVPEDGISSKAETLYDILPPPRPAYVNGDRPPSTVSSSDLRPPQSPDVGGRRSHSLSSSGSISSGHSDLQARKGSKGRASLSNSRSNSLSKTGGSSTERGSSDMGRKMDRLNSLEVCMYVVM